jgi:hypothetical protein
VSLINDVTSKKQGNGIIKSKVGLYSIKASSNIYRCPRTRGSNLECVILDGKEGKKRLEKYSGCNSFLVMN